MPLKKVGFHIKNGAMPHFRKIDRIIKNQAMPIMKTSFSEDTLIRYKKTCSIKYQSKVTRYLYKKAEKTNKLREESNETQ